MCAANETIGAVHAGCFSMALAAGSTVVGLKPTWISTAATVSLEKVGEGFKITTIELETEATVPGIAQSAFLDHAGAAKKNCPFIEALAGKKSVSHGGLICVNFRGFLAFC